MGNHTIVIVVTDHDMNNLEGRFRHNEMEVYEAVITPDITLHYQTHNIYNQRQVRQRISSVLRYVRTTLSVNG